MMYSKLVITGTGRSETRYASELFTTLGLRVGHQVIFNDRYRGGKIDWKGFSGDSSGLAAPFVGKLHEKVLVIHQVRHPAKTVHSLLQSNHVPGQKASSRGVVPKGMRHYADYVPGIFCVDGMHERACLLWVVERIAHQPNYLFHRVEDYNAEFLTKVLGFFNLKWTPERARAFHAQAKDTGTNKKPGEVVLSAIPFPTQTFIREMGQRYGYEV